MGNPVVHFELMSGDPARIGAFYEQTFGWSLQPRPELNYTIVDTKAAAPMQGIGGGIVKPDHPEPWPAKLTMYILVDDLDAYGRRIVAAGGRLLIEKQEVPGMGALTIFSDPEGRMMGLWRSADPAANP